MVGFTKINKSHFETKSEVKEESEMKPPIGIMPEWMWKEVRYGDLADAIKRYVDSGSHQVPNEWIEEYNRLCKEINNRLSGE
jgi:hypothetical protein